MPTRLPNRDALLRLAEVSAEYRAAFDEVQALLSEADLGPIPGWVFAIDRLPPDDLGTMGPALVEAELRRRRWRVALHALAELIALDSDGAATGVAPDPAADDANLPRLDRFISVINYARSGGCIYVNGGFQPVGRHVPEPEPKDTFDFPERVGDDGSDGPDGG